VAQLLARQLPQIAERLKSTLDKLQRPQIEASRGSSANHWWAQLQDRHAGDAIEWSETIHGSAELPEALFDSVAENLLQNALAKRQNESGIEISVNLTVDRGRPVLSVKDGGRAIAPEVLAILFRAPAKSAYGLGIGLYHAAKLAEDGGYRLELAQNQPGAVQFRLAQRN
jgi:signal transduction histidine kinase